MFGRHPAIRTAWVRAAALPLLVAWLGVIAAPASRAQSAGSGETTGSEPPSEWGINAAAWVLTVPYGAAKVAYAIVGGTVGVLTLTFSGGNKDSAMAVWTTSMGGDYLITPDHLRGRERLRFLGGQADAEQARAQSAAKR